MKKPNLLIQIDKRLTELHRQRGFYFLRDRNASSLLEAARVSIEIETLEWVREQITGK
jgi:hypothetical protein